MGRNPTRCRNNSCVSSLTWISRLANDASGIPLTAWLNKLGSPKPDLFILGRSQRPFLFRFVIPANPPAPLPPAKTRLRGRVVCGSKRVLASDLARFCRDRPLAAGIKTRISVEPERAAGYGLGGKRGQSRTLVRRVRGEPFTQALCAAAPIWSPLLPLQTLFVGLRGRWTAS